MEEIRKKIEKLPKEKRDEFLKEIFKDTIKQTEKSNKEIWMNPEKHFSIDEIGELHLTWFNQRYAYLKMEKYMPLFDRAYKLLTERGNFSRRNAFGEMHCNVYLWIEKCEEVEVIIEERQGYKMAYMKTNREFHIRELAYKYNWDVQRLKKCTLNKLKEQKFVPMCDYEKSCPNFLYGDARDKGYVLSMELDWMPDLGFTLPSLKKGIKDIGQITLSGIESLKYWEVYLDDPTQLE